MLFGEEFGAEGVTREGGFGFEGRGNVASVGPGKSNVASKVTNEQVGFAKDGGLFVGDDGDTLQSGKAAKRQGQVAAETEDGVGLVSVEDAIGLKQTGGCF